MRLTDRVSRSCLTLVSLAAAIPASREPLLTQASDRLRYAGAHSLRLVLQPRLESSASRHDEVDFGIGRGLSNTAFGGWAQTLAPTRTDGLRRPSPVRLTRGHFARVVDTTPLGFASSCSAHVRIAARNSPLSRR